MAVSTLAGVFAAAATEKVAAIAARRWRNDPRSVSSSLSKAHLKHISKYMSVGIDPIIPMNPAEERSTTVVWAVALFQFIRAHERFRQKQGDAAGGWSRRPTSRGARGVTIDFVKAISERRGIADESDEGKRFASKCGTNSMQRRLTE